MYMRVVRIAVHRSSILSLALDVVLAGSFIPTGTIMHCTFPHIIWWPWMDGGKVEWTRNPPYRRTSSNTSLCATWAATFMLPFACVVDPMPGPIIASNICDSSATSRQNETDRGVQTWNSFSLDNFDAISRIYNNTSHHLFILCGTNCQILSSLSNYYAVEMCNSSGTKDIEKESCDKKFWK
jgi:hypothetical protein